MPEFHIGDHVRILEVGQYYLETGSIISFNPAATWPFTVLVNKRKNHEIILAEYEMELLCSRRLDILPDQLGIHTQCQTCEHQLSCLSRR